MDFRSIHNYYECLAINYMSSPSLDKRLADKNSDFLLDVACYALSQLPARYMRHEIDMAFFLSPAEKEKMENEVKIAVDSAIDFISENFNTGDRYGPVSDETGKKEMNDTDQNLKPAADEEQDS